MKKNFFIISTIPSSLNFFRNQISELNNYFDVTLLSSPNERLRTIAEQEAVNYKGISMQRDISLFKDVISLFKIFFFFLRKRPYIIHCNTPKASLLGLLAGKITFVPVRIYYIHGLRYEGVVGLKRKVLIFMEKMSCWLATDLVSTSYGVRETVNNHISKKNIKVIHNGSPNGMIIEKFNPQNFNNEEIRREIGLSQDDFVFGFIGRIVGDKGINELVSAFAQISKDNKKTKLILIGNFEEKLDPLKQETHDEINNNESIIYLGYQTDIQKYLSAVDIFVSPSYREGFGLTLLEAGLMQKPVIATRITGYSEIIEDGVNGYLVAPRDESSLKNKMIQIINDSKELTEMGAMARKLVIEKYNHEDVIKEAIEYYKLIVNDKILKYYEILPPPEN